MLQWIDDTLVSQTFDDYLNSQEMTFVGLLNKKQIRLNLQKSELMRLSAAVCGRYVSKDRWRFQTRYFTKAKEAFKPLHVHDIVKDIFVVN